jgi:hypothetical protein
MEHSAIAVQCSASLGDVLRQIREISSSRRRRKWLLLTFVKLNHFFYDFAKFLEDSLLIVAVAAT